jgi:hypothetical protein
MIFDYFYVLYAYIYPYLCTIKPVYRAKADYRTYPPEYRPGGTRPVFRRVNPIYFHPVPRSGSTTRRLASGSSTLRLVVENMSDSYVLGIFEVS